MHPVFRVYFWKQQFPFLILFKGCHLNNPERKLLFSIILLLWKKVVAAIYISCWLFPYGACSKGQAMWLGWISSNPASSSWEESVQLRSTSIFQCLSAFSNKTVVVPCHFQSFLSSWLSGFWFVVWCSWPCKDLRVCGSWGLVNLDNILCLGLLLPNIYRIRSVLLPFPQGYSLWYMCAFHSLFELIGSSIECSAVGYGLSKVAFLCFSEDLQTPHRAHRQPLHL